VPSPPLRPPDSISWRESPLKTPISVIQEAYELYDAYGNRPIWQKPPYSVGEIPEVDDVPDVVAHLVACESSVTSISVIDSNGLPSRGVFQFQDGTWDQFSKESGIEGNPMNSTDAVTMALWAIAHGYLSHWSCAFLTGEIKR
jgi:hypothetical protein